jgi:hypothetical protein
VINLDSDSDDGFEIQQRPANVELPVGENAAAGPGPSTEKHLAARRSESVSDGDDEDAKFAKQLAREEGWDVDGTGFGRSMSQHGEHLPIEKDKSGTNEETHRCNSISPERKPDVSVFHDSTRSNNKAPIADIFLKPSGRVKQEPATLNQLNHTSTVLASSSTSIKAEPSSYVALHDLSSSAKLEVADAQTLDFDVDILTFRPEVAAMRMKPWPSGRLPYEMLVGVYVAVGGTRSRLAIIRILTK